MDTSGDENIYNRTLLVTLLSLLLIITEVTVFALELEMSMVTVEMQQQIFIKITFLIALLMYGTHYQLMYSTLKTNWTLKLVM